MRPTSISRRKTIFKNKFLELYTVSAHFKIFKKDYFVIDYGKRVGILIIKNGSVLLVKQYRYLLDASSYEIPGGRIEKNETPEQAAIRECFEETGVKCNSLIPLLDYMTGVEMVKCPVYLFYTTDFEERNVFDKKEIENIKWFKYEECIEMIRSRKVRDGMTIIALLMFNQNIKAIENDLRNRKLKK